MDIAAMEHARLARKLPSWLEVARRAGVDKSIISRWLNGTANGLSSRETVERVAAVLGLTYDEMTVPRGDQPATARNVRDDPQFKRDLEVARQELAKYPLTDRTRRTLATAIRELY